MNRGLEWIVAVKDQIRKQEIENNFQVEAAESYITKDIVIIEIFIICF